MLIILHVEDNADDADLVQRWLRREIPRLSYAHAHTLDEAEAMLDPEGAAPIDASKLDVLILDWNLPGSIGFEALKTFDRIAPQTPIVVVTGDVSTRLKTTLSRRGIEVLHKNSLTNLVQVVQRMTRRPGAEDTQKTAAVALSPSGPSRKAIAGAAVFLGGLLVEVARLVAGLLGQ